MRSTILSLLLLAVIAPTASARTVYLTFDDGPSEYTPQVLRTLDRFDVRATFFMVGEQVAFHPQYAQRVARAGHRIGNHTWTHPRLSETPFGDELEQLRRTNRLIEALTGRAPTLMRPPFGDYDAETEAATARLGLSMIGWDASSADWNPLVTSRQIVKWTLRDIDAGGSVILMHDTHPATVAALPRIIRALRRRGHELKRLPAHQPFVTFTGDPPEAEHLR